MENSYFYELYAKDKVEQERMKIIRNLLRDGVSVEQVSKLTEVPLERVKRVEF